MTESLESEEKKSKKKKRKHRRREASTKTSSDATIVAAQSKAEPIPDAESETTLDETQLSPTTTGAIAPSSQAELTPDEKETSAIAPSSKKPSDTKITLPAAQLPTKEVSVNQEILVKIQKRKDKQLNNDSTPKEKKDVTTSTSSQSEEPEEVTDVSDSEDIQQSTSASKKKSKKTKDGTAKVHHHHHKHHKHRKEGASRDKAAKDKSKSDNDTEDDVTIVEVIPEPKQTYYIDKILQSGTEDISKAAKSIIKSHEKNPVVKLSMKNLIEAMKSVNHDFPYFSYNESSNSEKLNLIKRIEDPVKSSIYSIGIEQGPIDVLDTLGSFLRPKEDPKINTSEILKAKNSSKLLFNQAIENHHKKIFMAKQETELAQRQMLKDLAEKYIDIETGEIKKEKEPELEKLKKEDPIRYEIMMKYASRKQLDKKNKSLDKQLELMDEFKVKTDDDDYGGRDDDLSNLEKIEHKLKTLKILGCVLGILAKTTGKDTGENKDKYPGLLKYYSTDSKSFLKADSIFELKSNDTSFSDISGEVNEYLEDMQKAMGFDSKFGYADDKDEDDDTLFKTFNEILRYFTYYEDACDIKGTNLKKLKALLTKLKISSQDIEYIIKFKNEESVLDIIKRTPKK